MNRAITGFITDDLGDWVALLDCGHRQHVRHDPPLVERPWVLSAGGRGARLGESFDCVRCDAAELPDSFVAYKRTAEFTEASVPDGLRRNHTTKAGVWGKIVVVEGRLRYSIDEWSRTLELDVDRAGIVVPQVRHHVEPLGVVRFFVEFYHAPDGPEG